MTNQSLLTLRFSFTQILLLGLSWIIGLAVIFFGNMDSALNTSLLFIGVTTFGLMLAKSTARSLGDTKLNILGTFWLFKVFATIILLCFGWIPDLEFSTSNSWGYDPQRYYYQSLRLIENNWQPDFGLNYMGIIYYYATALYFFGANPMVASLINIFVTLYGTLFLIRCSYAFAPTFSSKNWTISFLLLIPEVLWFDVITSREMFLAIVISTLFLVIGRKILAYKGEVMDSWLLAGVLCLAILSVRTSMIIPLILGSILMFLIFSKMGRQSSFKKGLIFLSIFGGISISLNFIPVVQSFLGSSSFNFGDALRRISSFDENVAASIDGWNERSIGMLLMPNNTFQAILYIPLRMILYLLAPLPNISVPISGLVSGSYSAWQNLMTILTSLLMTALFPYVLAGSLSAWRLRRQAPGLLIIPIAFWINFAAVAGGNLIIHERYRVMCTILIFVVSWIGYTQSNLASIFRWSIFWFSLLLSAALFYLYYKFVL